LWRYRRVIILIIEGQRSRLPQNLRFLDDGKDYFFPSVNDLTFPKNLEVVSQTEHFNDTSFQFPSIKYDYQVTSLIRILNTMKPFPWYKSDGSTLDERTKTKDQ
jgi:hypothetical protein